MNEDAVGEVMQAINAEICGRLGITVCYIHHAKKNTKDMVAMDAFLGSVSIVNAIRYGLFMVKKTNRLREVEGAKSNLGHDDIYFNAEMTQDHRVALTYAGVRHAEADQDDLSQLDKADEIILTMLRSGEAVPANLILESGKQKGISDKTMKTAKKLLSQRVGCSQCFQLNEALTLGFVLGCFAVFSHQLFAQLLCDVPKAFWPALLQRPRKLLGVFKQPF